MYDMISRIHNLQDTPEIMLLQMINGVTIICMIKEKKKFLKVYNPMMIARATTPDGKEFVRLVPYQPDMVVQSSATIIKKKHIQMFVPSEQFKMHYITRLNQKQMDFLKSTEEGQEETKTEENDGNNDGNNDANANNIISFTKFRKYQKGKKGNTDLVLVNTTEDGNVNNNVHVTQQEDVVEDPFPKEGPQDDPVDPGPELA